VNFKVKRNPYFPFTSSSEAKELKRESRRVLRRDFEREEKVRFEE
jgi:hypothetical protein